MQLNAFRQKLEDDVFACSLCTDCGYIAGDRDALHPFKIYFVCFNTVGYMNASPLGFQSFKRWYVRHVIQHFALQRAAGSWQFPSDHMVLCQGLGHRMKVCLSLSYQYWCAYFLSHPMCKSHSISFCISLRGHCSIGSCIFSVFMEGGRFRRLLSFHLGLEYS